MIYLDNGATTFIKPKEVHEAVGLALTMYGGNPGRGGHKLSVAAGRQVYHARETVAAFFNASDPMRVIFTSNGTDSLNMAIKGILNKGDHVVTTAYEHNSVYRPLTSMEDKKITYDVAYPDEQGQIQMVTIETLIKENTKLVIVNHVSNVNGNVVDIEKIGRLCREKNIIFLVDASQSAGVYDIDVQAMNIDLLACAGHKSLFGIQGTGVLYVGERANLNSSKHGGTGSRSLELAHPMELPDRYEAGTLNLPGIMALDAGIQFINKTGLENIRNHELLLSQSLFNGLKNIEHSKIFYRGGTLLSMAFGIEAKYDSQELAFWLDDTYDICVRSGFHCAPLAHRALGVYDAGTVRFSVGYFTTMEEIEQTIEAVSKTQEPNKKHNTRGRFLCVNK